MVLVCPFMAIVDAPAVRTRRWPHNCTFYWKPDSLRGLSGLYKRAHGLRVRPVPRLANMGEASWAFLRVAFVGN